MSARTQRGYRRYSAALGTTAPSRLADGDVARLLTYPAVDPLAQEVGVAAVPGVLLDHVHDHLA